MKKPRADSVLDQLPPAQQDALERWLFTDNLRYEDARARLDSEFGVKLRSLSPLSAWYQRRAQERLLARIAQGARKADAVVQQLTRTKADTFTALMGFIGQLAFDQAVAEGEAFDPATLRDLGQLFLSAKAEERKEREHALDERRVRVLEKKAEQAEQAKQVIESSLTPEEPRARLKEILK